VAIASEDIDIPYLLSTLREWVSIETPSRDGERINTLVDLVASRASASGLLVSRSVGQTGYGDLLIVRSRTARTETKGLLVLAHLDTVHPVGTLSEHFGWREEQDRIYGPGIYDMKSGALMALHALELVAKTTGENVPPITVMFTPDEEIGSKCSRAAIELEARGAKAALVVEPARDGGKIVVARKGGAIFDVEITGRASHAGTRPLDGRSAIREAAKVVLMLEEMNDVDRGVTVTVGTIDGGSARNVVPERCRLEVDVRLPDMAAAEAVIARILAIKASDPDITIRTEGGLTRPPYAQSVASQALFQQASRLAEPLGITLQGVISGGGSDGNFTAALGVPTLDGLGADGGGAHTRDEHIIISSIAPRTALLANLLLSACPVDGSEGGGTSY
jgi:glutamate carboxypeptidase